MPRAKPDPRVSKVAHGDAADAWDRSADAPDRYAGVRLFAVSFVALFLELMVIRWVPATIKYVAYYANLLLISSFLGLGLGAMLARRKSDLFGLFPLLLALYAMGLVGCRVVSVMPGSGSEVRFYAGASVWMSYVLLIGTFTLNTAMFVPLGQRIGRLFEKQPPLRSYAWDLGGSLCGTIVFGLFSLYHFSPAIGVAAVLLIYLALAAGRQRLWNLPVLTLILIIVPFSIEPGAVWSPYYYITVYENGEPVSPAPGGLAGADQRVNELRTMRDPPLFSVHVNQDFYQQHGTIDIRRYTPGSQQAVEVETMLRNPYLLPYTLRPDPQNVCVVGAGGGIDVEAALLSGARHVDAVEIDPVLASLSRRLNASGVYDDPRVTIHIDDARAFFRRARPGYDLVVFGFLDSQALLSYSSNVRLDGFIYTVESIHTAYGLLNDDGLLSLSFVAPRPWLADKLVGMVAQGTGTTPIVYRAGVQYIICARRGKPAAISTPLPSAAAPVAPPAPLPQVIGRFVHDPSAHAPVDLPTDDWPYLYLSRRTIPGDYLMVIGALLVLTIVAVAMIRLGKTGRALRWNIGPTDAHFFFLGVGFLLLETKSIGDCSLYFGTTWFVTMLVVAGVLLMVLGANLMAMRLRTPSARLYVPLFVTLVALYLVPRDQVLALPFAARLAWAALAVPLPIFFAGLIFSTTYREGRDPSGLLGANLIGATVGGFSEYLGMVIGTQSLMLLVIAAYAASFFFWTKARSVNAKAAGMNPATA